MGKKILISIVNLDIQKITIRYVLYFYCETIFKQ